MIRSIYSPSEVRRRLAVASVMSVAAVAVLLPSVASGGNDRLACELAPLDVIQPTFSYPVHRARRTSSAVSPTAPPPDDKLGRYGSDFSGCVVQAWKKGPYPEDDFHFGFPHFNVPSGIGELHVATWVADPSEAGRAFNAGKLYAELLNVDRIFGWPTPPVPLFGAERAHGGWFGSRDRVAFGDWQVGKAGMIELMVYAHRRAARSLRRAARLIVPNFSLALTPASGRALSIH